MLGVPTRSDAVRISPEYAAAVREEELVMWLSSLVFRLREVFALNHLVECYRDTGNDQLFTKFAGNVQGLRGSQVPRRVIALLKPELIRDRYLGKARDQQLQAKSLLGEPSTLTGQEAELYKLIQLALNELRLGILRAYNTERTKLGKILAIMQVVDDTQSGENYQGIREATRAYDIGLAHKLELELEPVHGLYREYLRLTEPSDVFLQFPERSLQFNTPSGSSNFPAVAWIDPEKRMEYYSLNYRVALRDLVDRILQLKSRIVISGVGYTRSSLRQAGKRVTGFTADGPTHQEFANMLGAPIKTPKGRLIVPEAWATNEVKWVNAFVTDQDAEATDALLAAYNLDTSYGNPTRQKAIKQLTHTCYPRSR